MSMTHCCAEILALETIIFQIHIVDILLLFTYHAGIKTFEANLIVNVPAKT